MSGAQETLDKIPQSDVLVMSGDFKVRVGVLKPNENMCYGTHVLLENV